MEVPPVIAANPPRRPLASAGFWVVVSGLLCAGAVLFCYNPSTNGFYPRCWLYTNTGIYCPGCGSLRALHQLVHGHLLTAVRCNLALILSLPFAVIFATRWILRWVKGQPPPPLLLRPAWLKFILAALVLFTLLRNIPSAPFIYLAPP